MSIVLQNKFTKASIFGWANRNKSSSIFLYYLWCNRNGRMPGKDKTMKTIESKEIRLVMINDKNIKLVRIQLTFLPCFSFKSECTVVLHPSWGYSIPFFRKVYYVGTIPELL